MENNLRDRIIGILLWVGLALLTIAILFGVIQPLFSGNKVEFYVRLAIFIFSVQTLAVARMYNAVVQNTRFVLKLNEAVIKMEQALPKLENTLRSVQSAMSNQKSSLDISNRSSQTLSQKMQELTEEISKYKQLKEGGKNA